MPASSAMNACFLPVRSTASRSRLRHGSFIPARLRIFVVQDDVDEIPPPVLGGTVQVLNELGCVSRRERFLDSARRARKVQYCVHLRTIHGVVQYVGHRYRAFRRASASASSTAEAISAFAA